MSLAFARTDQSPIAQWWWTVDRWTLLALAVLIGFGSLLIMAASPAVADRIGSTNGAAVLSGLPLRLRAPEPQRSWLRCFW